MLPDFQPYICTYPGCSDALQMYSSRHRWLEHERLAHRRVSQCFHHADSIFSSPATLRDHLKSKTEHGEYVTETQIEALLDVCESSIADTRTTCPICLADGPFKKGFDNHVSFHLESFAIFSVPRGIILDETESETDSKSGKAQARLWI